MVKTLSRVQLAAGVSLLAACSLSGGSSASGGSSGVTLHTDFDRGSLGDMVQIGPTSFRGTTRHWREEDGIGDQYYWFYFRAEGTKGKKVDFQLDQLTGIYRGNRHEVYTDHTRPVYSYDRKSWHRIEEVEYQEEAKSFRFSHAFDRDTVWIAYAHPYPWTAAEEFVRSLQGRRYVDTETVAASREGRPITLVTVTDPGTPDAGKRVVFIQAVQHAGEDVGAYYAEGAIRFLLSDEPEARTARERFVYKIIPVMNPDGLRHGTTRYNLDMEDLNSIWMDEPAPQPEVAGVRRWLESWRGQGRCIDAFIDVHSHTQQIRTNNLLVRDQSFDTLIPRLQRHWQVGRSVTASKGTAAEYVTARHGVPGATLELTQSDLGDGDYLDVDDYRRFGAATVRAITEHMGPPSGSCGRP